MPNKIVAIPALKDNYIWAIHSKENNEILVVDPGEAQPVLDYLSKNHLNLKAVLITHHHWDHSGGITALRQTYPFIDIYGPAKEQSPITGITQAIDENNTLPFTHFDITLKVFDIPGHTLGHIAYYNDQFLFCGDTLFSCGCGRLFEGTPQQMVSSLEKLRNLPDATQVYCGHEYTLANIKFAQMVEPTNTHLEKYRLEVEQKRKQNLPSLPSTIGVEKQVNPFLRWDNSEIIKKVQQEFSMSDNDPVSVFAHLREWKNNF